MPWSCLAPSLAGVPGFYLKGWAQETFSNWPMQWWIQTRACPGSTPGLVPGVACANISGQLQAAEM